MAQDGTATKIKVNTELKEPPLFKVIYLNDNTTAMEFVIDSLVNFFDYSTETALQITENIHTQGSAVVAVLPYEIAEQKGVEVTLCARTNNYPLQLKLEPEAV
jgi:ATP-dependent Clp protease adaptor protein ClpS